MLCRKLTLYSQKYGVCVGRFRPYVKRHIVPLPNVILHRPPRGRFSHLAMFRIGTIMFIPAYLTVVLYRPLANKNSADESNPLLMLGALPYKISAHSLD